jgi:hypothetical protein
LVWAFLRLSDHPVCEAVVKSLLDHRLFRRHVSFFIAKWRGAGMGVILEEPGKNMVVKAMTPNYY